MGCKRDLSIYLYPKIIHIFIKVNYFEINCVFMFFTKVATINMYKSHPPKTFSGVVNT